jgi:xylulokinase
VSERPPVLLGIDLGTTRVKVGLITPSGRPLGIARAGYPIDTDPATGRAEQDPEAWWRGLARAIRDLRTSERGEIIGIAAVGHGPTMTPVDHHGRPTGPAMTWLDSRARGESAELEGATGLRGWSLGVLPAALWLARREPEAAKRATWFLNSWEALALRLTGRASTTLVPGQSFPGAQVLASAGLDPGRIAPTCPAGAVLGGLTNAAAGDLGLGAGTPVIAGLVDAFASFHGARMVESGDAIDVGGAAGGFGVYWDRRVEAAGSFSTPAPLEGLWSVGGAMAATGSALDWFAGDLLRRARSIDELIAEAAAEDPGADGLIFLPYLAGERSPLWDPSARGVLAGLTLTHGRGHVARAILEAAALAIRHVAEPILGAGVTVTAMRVCGGPAHSEAWNQLKADVTGFPVEVPRVLETTVVGAALIAAVGIGAHPDVPTAIRAMTAIERRLDPNPALRETYDRVYAAYTALYPAVAPVLARAAGSLEPVGAGT